MDLLVKLYDLPALQTSLAALQPQNIVIRPAMAYEKFPIVAWVRNSFGEGWASECEIAFAHQPIACHLAVDAGAILGFACYDSTCRGFFGPTGVDPAARRRGIGAALLLSCLHGMRVLGYGYAIIGGVSDDGFYRHVVDALPIAGSTPGIYRDRLQR